MYQVFADKNHRLDGRIFLSKLRKHLGRRYEMVTLVVLKERGIFMRLIHEHHHVLRVILNRSQQKRCHRHACNYKGHKDGEDNKRLFLNTRKKFALYDD